VLEEQEAQQQQEQQQQQEGQEDTNRQLGDGQSEGGTPSPSSASVRRQQLEDVLRLRFGYHLFQGRV